MGSLFRRLLFLLRRSRHEADLREEMETHRTLRQDRLERDGLTAGEAAPASRRAFGNAALVREDVREIWMAPALHGVWQDIRTALRVSRRDAASSITIVFTLILGLGLASAIFAFGDGHLTRALPFPDDERLFVVLVKDARRGHMRLDELEGLRASAVGHLGFVTSGGDRGPLSWAGWLHVQDRRIETRVGGVSESFARVMGVPLVLGRPFGDDDHMGLEPVPVWLSHRFWQSEFGGDPDILHRTFAFQKSFDSSERVSVVVVGVTDPRVTTFSLNFGANMSLPALFAPTVSQRSPDEDPAALATPIVRLPHHMSREQAEAAIGAVLQGVSPAPQGGTRAVQLEPLRERMAGGGRPTAMLFFAGAVLALALVTVNLVHLLLARGVSRAGEIATRAALGASRLRMARMLLIESALYAGVGIVGGLLVGRWLTNTIAAGIPTRGSDTSNLALVAMTFDARVILFAIVAGLIVTVLGSVWPVWRIVYRTSALARHAKGRSAVRVSPRFSRLSLTCEVAISTVILMGAAFVGLGIWKYVNQPIGFDLTDRFSLSFPPSSAANEDAVDWRAVLEGVRTAPGVRSVSIDQTEELRDTLRAGERELSELDVTAVRIEPSWLETRGVGLLKGRWIEPVEVETNAPVTVVDARFAQAVWPDADAIGRTIHIGSGPARTVVGVASPQRFRLSREGPGIAYLAEAFAGSRQSMRIWAPKLTAADLIARLGEPLRVLAPGYSPVIRAETFQDTFRDDLADARFQRPIIIALGLFALTLSGVGLFGLVAYLVEQRMREFGIRIALGAGRADIVRGVVVESAAPGAAGLTIGLAAWWGIEGLVRAAMFGLDSSGPEAMAVVSAAVLSSIVAAAAGPALRVLRIDPAAVLKAE